jgi:CheY-like chemotaxis protein
VSLTLILAVRSSDLKDVDIEPGQRAAAIGRVLIIEDDPDVQALEALALRGAGWVVDVADDGRDGLAKARELKPDVVLTDLLMTGLDGLGVLAALKGDPDTAAIPVVLVSGLMGDDSIATALGAGAHGFVAKPFTVEGLRAGVASAAGVVTSPELW